ncbi:MAG: TolC family protein [Candidatus Binatia bacterium]
MANAKGNSLLERTIPATWLPKGALIGGLVLSVVSVFGSPVSAFAAESKALRLEDVVEDARSRNAGLQASRERAQAMHQIPAQVSAWEDPTLSYEAWNAPDSFRLDHADNNIFRLSQKIPFPGKRRLAGDIATYDADRATREVGSVELALISAVKTAYYGLWKTHARLAVLERDRDLVARLTRVVESKYGTSDASQSDVLRLQVELTHMTNQLETERLVVDRDRAELASLLSRDSTEVTGIPVAPGKPQLPIAVSELVAMALEKRPDLLGENEAIGRDTTAVQLAHRNSLPDFEVSVGRFINDGQRDGVGAMASITLPIFNRGKYEAGVAEANARLAATRSDKRRLEDRVRREVEQAYIAARTALLQYELFVGTHIPQAEQALHVTEAGYEAGGVQFVDLIDTVRAVQSVHLEHIAAQAEFEKAYAELAQAVGAELPRPEVSVPARAKGHHE